jgi:hypothetical protein
MARGRKKMKRCSEDERVLRNYIAIALRKRHPRGGGPMRDRRERRAGERKSTRDYLDEE